MRQISIGGRVIEITERDLLDLLAHQAEGNYFFAVVYIMRLLGGFPFGLTDMPEPGKREITKSIHEFLQQVENQIEDEELREAYDYLKKALEELKKIDRQAIDWLATLVRLAPPRDNRDKRKLRRRLNKLIAASGGQSQGPVWAVHPEYQAIVQKAADILPLVEQSKQQFDRRFRQLLAQCPEEPTIEISEEARAEAIRKIVSALPKSLRRLVLIEGEPYEIWARRMRGKLLP